MPSAKCRCGWDGEGEHPCHRCKRPGRPRFIAELTCVVLDNTADVQSLGARETCACDDCWAAFNADEQFNMRTRRRHRAITPQAQTGYDQSVDVDQHKEEREETT